MPSPPSVGRSLAGDRPAIALLVCAGALSIATIAAIGFADAEDRSDGLHLALCSALTATAFVLAAIAAARVARIRRAFRRGRLLQGTVVATGTNVEDVGWIDVAWESGGTRRQARIILVAAGPGIGSTVELVVDPSAPDRPFLASAFADCLHGPRA